MARPGVEVVARAAPPARGAPSETGVWFVAGLADRGPTVESVRVRNMTEFARYFGVRVSYSVLHDALDTFFREGGTEAFVTRVVGPAAAVDTVTINDVGLAPSIAVDSVGEGATGLDVEAIDGGAADTFVLVVRLDGGIVEQSPDLDDPTVAVAWSSGSPYVRVRSLGANDPAPSGVLALGGGDDDRASITDAHRVAALDRFTKGLGPGQVSFPGATTASVYSALVDHAAANNRVALLDGQDTTVPSTLTAAADTLRVDTVNDNYGALFAPWVTVPGITRGTTRTVPPSSFAAGIIARSDSLTENPNVAAAGAAGEARFALGLSQAQWTDTEREDLNENGVNVIRMVFGEVRLYGYRTVAPEDDAWLSLAAARLRMAIVNEAEAIAEEFLFSQLDGRGRKIGEYNGALTGILQRYWTIGALYGETADEAFGVETGPTVNTPATLAANELHAVLSVRTSPFAELARIEIVKVALTQSL